tara:strand:- start:3929 stop:4186 length:258 start_codon:yes stop_codon:yes gene_type:complete
MNRKKRIEGLLKENLSEYNCTIIDTSINHKGHNDFDGTNETHFKIIINNLIKNKKKLTIHRKINELLKNEFKSGLHALEIKILDQ